MSKKTYYVWKPAEVWYRLEVEANDEEQALSLANHPVNLPHWELDLETLSWTDFEMDVQEKEED